MRHIRTRVAQRFLRRIALDASKMSDKELVDMSNFFADIVDSLDDASVAYGSYTAMAVPGVRQHLLGKLGKALLLSYRKRLVGWFEFALVKRAQVGGGGSKIAKIEEGLADFVEAIPNALNAHRKIKVSDFVPTSDYLLPERLDPVGEKILNVVAADARQAGVWGVGRTAALNLPLRYDDAEQVWFVDSNNTYAVKDGIKSLGLRWNPNMRRWETSQLTPAMRQEFRVLEPSAGLRDWYFEEWLPKNIGRFTRVFTDYVRNQQSSYQFIFAVSGDKVKVDFKRDATTPAKAVEELRYRYIGRQGREPWLEVMDKFIQLVDARSPSQIEQLIDRINNLQHSNGLFMEHFPSNVKNWYEGFLNAKYSTPTADMLAKQIPDKDLSGLLYTIALDRLRPADFQYMPGPAYHLMKKELADVGTKVNYRELGYPRYKGVAQVDRFDPEVQFGLEVLKRLDTQRELILSTKVETPEAEKQVLEKAEDWAKEHAKAVADLQRLLEEQRRRKLEEPGYAEAWEATNFPQEFVERFPYAAPGITPSQVAEWSARYGTANKVG
jgi:hypothetical protein